MAHGRLGCAGRHAVLAEVGAEGVAQGVEVHRSAPVVPLRDAGSGKVPVEYLHEVRRHGEQRLGDRQRERHWPADEFRVGTRLLEFVVEPSTQVLREVRP